MANETTTLTSMTTVAGDGEVHYEDPPLEVPGLVCTLIFYALILGTGLFVSWKKGSLKSKDMADVMLAGRNLNFFVGIFTLTATAVGGGYINGTAEVIFTPGWGLIWLQAPIGYSISIACGGWFFGGKMRAKGYFTMLDPFEERYGRVVAGINFLPALLGEIFWNSAILAALGTSLQVILGVGRVWSVIISSMIAYFYTLVGGLYSVAYTDVIQIILVNFGLWLGFGFALHNDAVTDIVETSHMMPDSSGNGTITGWIGKLNNDHWVGSWVDSAFLVLMGGLPWQDLFQRVLAARTPRQGQWLGVIGGMACIIPAIPALLIGAVAASADWSKTEYAKYGPTPPTDYSMAIPLVLQYLCPKPVAVIGLGALAAAVMSSADSSALSASSMFAKNIYKPIREAIYPGSPASGSEIIWTMRGCIIVVGVISTIVALTVKTIYGLFILCADLVFVILFPQLLCVVHMEFTNTYGSLFGFALSTFFRLAGGEPLFNMRPCIWYPWAEEIGGEVMQKFPFKTLSMLIGLTGIIVMSLLTNWLFKSGILPARWDVFESVVKADPETWDPKSSPRSGHRSNAVYTQPEYNKKTPPPDYEDNKF